MNREELQKVHDALALLNSMVNCGEQHSPTSINMTQAAFAILRKLLPPAEGAEEILEKHCHLQYNQNTGEREVCSSVSAVEIAMQEFAALHVQRLAEKMVSERLRKELMMFGDYFNNLDPNDHILVNHILVNDIDEYLKSKER